MLSHVGAAGPARPDSALPPVLPSPVPATPHSPPGVPTASDASPPTAAPRQPLRASGEAGERGLPAPRLEHKLFVPARTDRASEAGPLPSGRRASRADGASHLPWRPPAIRPGPPRGRTSSALWPGPAGAEVVNTAPTGHAASRREGQVRTGGARGDPRTWIQGPGGDPPSWEICLAPKQAAPEGSRCGQAEALQIPGLAADREPRNLPQARSPGPDGRQPGSGRRGAAWGAGTPSGLPVVPGLLTRLLSWETPFLLPSNRDSKLLLILLMMMMMMIMLFSQAPLTRCSGHRSPGWRHRKETGWGRKAKLPGQPRGARSQ